MWGVEQGLEMLAGHFRGSGEDDATSLAHAVLANRKMLAGARLCEIGSRLLPVHVFQLLASQGPREFGQVVE
ncbi:hypothetical protein, partial [Pseudomonas aeruginosa]|uniref:hypothetical protein n=1 Tax=Pseudomonas aeruginosa TaxID=287 RepID=UPI001D0B366F